MSETPAPMAAAPTGTRVQLPLVAIVGRPNVGKSALFNRIVGRRKAIVEDEAGTTRDRNYAEADWWGRPFRVVDTGGLLGEAVSGPYATPISEQVGQALGEADAICLVVDVRDGLLAFDQDVAALLREASQPVFVVGNKADSVELEPAASEFYALGLGEPMAVSALHGRGIGDLLDRVMAVLPEVTVEEGSLICKLAIVGRPNVGKSSIVNRILDEERMIVSATPGTTRDAVDTEVEFEGKRYLLIDTAGLRRRGKVEPGVERASVVRARRAIDRADVVAVVMDSGENVAAQDQHVLGMALDVHRGVVLTLNKSDLLAEDAEAIERRSRQLQWRARFVPWAPAIWTSAAQGSNLDLLLRTATTVAEERRRRVGTGELNALIKRSLREHPPGAIHGRAVKIYYATQVGIEPPTFHFFVNFPDGVHFSYQRFLERQIRETFGFEGAAIRMVLRGRSGHDG